MQKQDQARLNPQKPIRKDTGVRVDKNLYNYLQNEWRIRNHPKYQHYFQEWIKNITDTQISYFIKWFES